MAQDDNSTLAPRLRVNWTSLGLLGAVGITASFVVEIAVTGGVALTGFFGVLRVIGLAIYALFLFWSEIALLVEMLWMLIEGLARLLWWVIKTPVKALARLFKGPKT